MADFTLNCQTDASANPYTPAAITIQIGTLKNVNGTGCNAATNGTNNQAVHNAQYSSTIRCDLTYGATGAADLLSACVLVRTGGNVSDGYQYYVNGTFARLAILSANGTSSVDIAGTTFSYTPAPGDILSCIYNRLTGALSGLVNGVTQSSTTDTTYQTETSMAPGFTVNAGNVNASIVREFQGTGLSGNGGATLSWIT